MLDLDALTLEAAVRHVRSGRVRAVELVEAVLERIAATEPLVNAYAHVAGDAALEAARRCDAARARGEPLGPLAGVPVGVKDVFWTSELPTRAGSRLLAEFVAPADAAAVRLLRSAGGILVGKHVTHELACGQDVPPTRNAWDTTHYPGGSSAGAGVSVVLGTALAALGTDAGGSVRKPAALNGVVGLKPTYGRISRFGIVPPSGSLDHVGIVTRTVEDAAIVLQAIAGRDPLDPSSSPVPVGDYLADLRAGVRGARLGVPSYFFGSELLADVRAVVEDALSALHALGLDLVPLRVPSLELVPAIELTILLGEGGASHRRRLADDAELYGDATRRMLELGALLPASHVEAARRARELVRAELATAFSRERLDAIVGPTLPRTSIPVDHMDVAVDLAGYIRYTAVANVTGLPALTVPCGFAPPGLPVGLHVVGRPFDEATVLRIGRAYETERPWPSRRPPLLDRLATSI